MTNGWAARPDTPALRRCALAVSVLHDVDLLPGETGLTLTATPQVSVTWQDCRRAVAGADPDSETGRFRLARWLTARRWVADRPLDDLRERARPVGYPVEDSEHPGLDWIRARPLGDTLDLGLGFVGLDPADPDGVVVVPEGVLVCAGIDAAPWWSVAEAYLEDMGAMAAARWRRDPRVPLRPMGDCDVVTLLGSQVFRGALASGEAGGLRAIAVPSRTRGWLDLRRIDPAFALAAAALVDPFERGFPRPLLVTAHEVTMVREGGRPAEVVLRDPAPATPDLRDVLYR